MNFRYFIPFLVMASSTLYLCGVPYLGASISSEILNQIIRKSGHIVLFSILTYLLWKSLPMMDCRPKAKIVLCMAFLLGFSAVTEVYQTFVPGRRGNMVGFSFDVFGVLLMVAYLIVLKTRRLPACDSRSVNAGNG